MMIRDSDAPAFSSLLSRPTRSLSTLQCFLPLTRAYADDDVDETTPKNRQLYQDMGIESVSPDSDASSKRRRLQGVLKPMTSHVPFICRRVHVPIADIIEWLGPPGGAKVCELRKNPLYQAIEQRMCPPRRPNKNAKSVVVMGVPMKKVKIALGFNRYSSLGSIVKRMSAMLDNMPISLISMMTRPNNSETGKRTKMRIMPVWLVPFFMASLPQALRGINRPPSVEATLVIRDMSIIIENDTAPAENPLVREMDLLERALTAYDTASDRMALENLVTNNAIADRLLALVHHINGVEVFCYDFADDMGELHRRYELHEQSVARLQDACDECTKKLAELESRIEYGAESEALARTESGAKMRSESEALARTESGAKMRSESEALARTESGALAQTPRDHAPDPFAVEPCLHQGIMRAMQVQIETQEQTIARLEQTVARLDAEYQEYRESAKDMTERFQQIRGLFGRLQSAGKRKRESVSALPRIVPVYGPKPKPCVITIE